jgi:single-stranded-DNA-specific exonuclease
VALGNIGDMEDVRTYETKYLIDKGLKNVKNKCLLALIKSQEYSMKGIINIKNIQWSIVPVINAMCRIGSIEEQELMFKAFIEQDEYFDYTTKGSKDKPSEAIQESIYDRVARLCKNVKQRQDKQKVKGTEALYDIVINECSNDKIIIVDATEYLDDSLSGVTAMNIASIFRKPCLLLFKRLSEGTEIEIYGGSARNCNNSPIKNLKDVIQSCKIFNLAQGHGNAFGIELDIDKMQLAKDTLNNILKDVVYDTAYTVDFILSTDELDYSLIYEIDKLSDMIGQGIEEVLIAIENVSITKDNITILGKNNNTISFYINDIKLIQFNCKNGTTLFDWFNDWGSNNTVTINIVGKPKIDLYNNVKTTQVEIVDVEIISSENKEEIENEDVVW